MNEEKNPAVSEKELEAIGRFSRRKLTAEEVYTFPVVLCDNDLDRDNECFTDAALEKLAVLFCGKTGIFDHDPRGEKQTARIYRCAVEPEDGRLNHRGEPYKALKGWAYMVRTAANADLILEIEGGIKKEVSVGCAVGKRVCSVCGADRTEEGCGHLAGKRYGGALCYTLLEDPTDAYEWSFVAVPAQPRAGVLKRCGGEENGTLKALVKRRGSRANQKELETLEQQAALGKRYLSELRGEVKRLVLVCEQEADGAAIEKLAAKLGLPKEDIQTVKVAGLLHDIGKIGIQDSILKKQGKLTDEEYSIIKTHVEKSVEMIRVLPHMDYVIPAVLSHHERYDGKGYPNGIRGNEIPILGRILTVCDSFDAMVSRRAYKEAMSIEYATGELERGKGTQFDPDVAQAFIELIREDPSFIAQ